ncbi:hypothetical protein MLIT_28280 [Mycolicibacterium litorale]|uniref:Integral membrane protein n=1 Tax=Mycolicibacterium litorale TaxID=758802 RepID=A0AAD1MVH2_9MYCO|nr:hypothetical protein BCL50_1383 [Mycolicibacterium litorale]BBY17236.1 hypothetical protein MLIT_28280 [Mycolicibacterium litorale]
MLTSSTFSYAIGLILQSIAARRTITSNSIERGLVIRLATDRCYAWGLAAQVAGFLLAFYARETLPVYLVQAAACAAVGVAAVMGAVAFGWRVTRAEAAVLAVLTVALVLLAGAAEPSRVTAVPPATGWVLTALLASCLALAPAAWRARGAVPLAGLAGAAFAVLAVASRPLPALDVTALPLQPLAWLTLAAAAVGQILLAAALQRGSTTSAGSAMDAVTMVAASAAGLALVGDRIADGRTAWLVVGLILVVAGVLAMARVGTVVGEPIRHTDNDVADQPITQGNAR